MTTATQTLTRYSDPDWFTEPDPEYVSMYENDETHKGFTSRDTWFVAESLAINSQLVELVNTIAMAMHDAHGNGRHHRSANCACTTKRDGVIAAAAKLSWSRLPRNTRTLVTSSRIVWHEVVESLLDRSNS